MWTNWYFCKVSSSGLGRLLKKKRFHCWKSVMCLLWLVLTCLLLLVSVLFSVINRNLFFLMTEKNQVNSVIMPEDIRWWILLWQVFVLLWDKWLKCLSKKTASNVVQGWQMFWNTGCIEFQNITAISIKSWWMGLFMLANTNEMKNELTSLI